MSITVSQAQKDAYKSALDDLHTIFGKTIQVVRENTNVTVIDDENFNAFSDRKNSNITYSATITDVVARIKYVDNPESDGVIDFGGKLKGAVSVDIKQNYGFVRIKVKKVDSQTILDSTKIMVNGEDCSLYSAARPHGLFNIDDYVTFYLIRGK